MGRVVVEIDGLKSLKILNISSLKVVLPEPEGPEITTRRLLFFITAPVYL
jgi:hypothetical protein